MSDDARRDDAANDDDTITVDDVATTVADNGADGGDVDTTKPSEDADMDEGHVEAQVEAQTDNPTLTTNDKTQDSDEVMALKTEIAQLREESQKNLDGWQRSRAEFTNYKKRVQKELSDANARVSLDTLSKVLPIIDDFERAINNIPDDIAENPWVSGTSLILKKFEKLLSEYDVVIIDPVGESFDPHQHEAIGMDDSGEYESGTVTTTLQKGYASGDRVLRPALVRVAN